MRNSFQYKLVAVISLVFVVPNLKAQNDANCGIAIEGQMIDKIDCWGFKNAGVIFPIDLPKWEKYDAVSIKVYFRVRQKNGKIWTAKELQIHSKVLSFYFEKEKMDEWFSNAKLGYWKIANSGKTKELQSDQFSYFPAWYILYKKDNWDMEEQFFVQFEITGHNKGKSVPATGGNGSFIFKCSYYDEGTILFKSKEYPITCYEDKSLMETGPKKVPGVDPKVPCAREGEPFDLKTEAVNYRDALFVVQGVDAKK